LFEYVRRQDHPVTREEAADAQGVSRNLAAFHLDKLVEVGLLQARYEAPADQPRGRGRTPKVYRPSGDALTLTVPERRYELVAEILADAVAEDPTRAAEAAHERATRRGVELGRQLAPHVPPNGDAAVQLATVGLALDDLGFEPRPTPEAGLILANCPFHALAQRQRELICGLNHSFVAAFLAGLGAGCLTAHLVPRPEACCVEISTVD
jgi:predicted ArsR family transcriptional regulator